MNALERPPADYGLLMNGRFGVRGAYRVVLCAERPGAYEEEGLP